MRTTVIAVTTAAALAIAPSLAIGEENKDGAPAANAVGAGANWDAEVAPAPGAGALDAKQVEAVNKVSAYFNQLETLKGSFVQVGPDKKRLKGKFFVKRPGKFRFNYSRPSKQIIISDGVYLAIQDHDINVEDRFSLDQTPFRLLLRQNVDLLNDAKIGGVQVTDEMIVMTLRDKDPDAPGRIQLMIGTTPKTHIDGWITTDAQNLDTQVEVSDLVEGEEIDTAMFKIKAVTRTPKIGR